MKTLLATLAYVALSADGIIGVVVRTREVVGRFGQANLQVTKSSPPDSVELLLSTESCTVELSMTILPVDSDAGPAYLIEYRWCAISDLFTPISSKGSDAQTNFEELAEEFVRLVDRKLRQTGARKVAPRELISAGTHRQVCLDTSTFVNDVASLICLHQELSHYTEIESRWQEVALRWYGTPLWISTNMGVIAAHIHFHAPGYQRKTLFFRWRFWWTDSLHREICVSFEYSVAGMVLDNRSAIERVLVEELIRQTVQQFSRPARGVVQPGNSVPSIGSSSSASPSSTPSSFKAALPAGSRSTYWPSMQDYNEAVQNLNQTIADEHLRSGELQLQKFGLPFVVSGAFACVYKVRCYDGDYAVRCFSAPVKDHADRFRRISRFICGDNLPYTLDFHFIEKGILLNSEWFPIVKMRWVEGDSLNSFLAQHYNDAVQLDRFRSRFTLMILELARDGIAHGDLQHGNIIVQPGGLTLVDYDGVFVPGLEGYRSREKGHPNYQHPARGEYHFGPYLDNFSAWLIDTAILALIEDPSLWYEFGGDESILFRRSDLTAPNQSRLFATLQA